ncbi:4-deoxy-4-formamido-L-arabinose-phosphoundecaprenol deformylase [bacterium]|nr:MAG: 4-deoxy-4-formamido-L-arabinose-phosphoundecaprenol deformylase [bacterium]
MKSPAFAIKVDVDTYVGTGDGVPRLVEILDSFGVRATFYFSLGPDNSGKAIRRIFTRKGFLKKMLRTKAPSMYGLRTLLYGTLLPAPMIGKSFPDILKKTKDMGHEVGIHCWDHVQWHDLLPKMKKEDVAEELGRAGSVFREIFGECARTTAAPGWTVSPQSLEVQDSMSLLYCSDTRGSFPFFPVVDGLAYHTLQIPTTFPTMDELLGLEGITPETINDRYLTLIRPGLNVHTIHAELEGMSLSHVFADLLQRLAARGVRFVTLAEASKEATGHHPPRCILSMGEIPGRAGSVAVQQGIQTDGTG